MLRHFGAIIIIGEIFNIIIYHTNYFFVFKHFTAPLCLIKKDFNVDLANRFG